MFVEENDELHGLIVEWLGKLQFWTAADTCTGSYVLFM